MMNICIVQPNRYTYSETFIRRHIAMLSASHNVSLFYPYGDGFGNRDGPFLKKAGLVRRAGRSMMRRLFRVDAEYFTRKATVSRLIQGNTNVVLAEYGQMGVHMLPACKEADIPLVVHFHGYDAYYGPVLQEYRSRYLEMFRYAAKIISVSLDMTNQLAALGCPKEKICL